MIPFPLKINLPVVGIFQCIPPFHHLFPGVAELAQVLPQHRPAGGRTLPVDDEELERRSGHVIVGGESRAEKGVPQEFPRDEPFRAGFLPLVRKRGKKRRKDADDDDAETAITPGKTQRRRPKISKEAEGNEEGKEEEEARS